MKEYYYGCDGGAIAIGTRSATVNICNGIGDGRHKVKVYDLNEGFDDTGYKFIGSVEGCRINIYDYDCLLPQEKRDKKHILCTLKGRYSIYTVVGSGEIVLQCWDKWGY